MAQRLKHLPAMRETWVRSLGQEDPLEKEMATHSSILAWRIPWTEEHGGLQSTGSQRVGHNWETSLTSLTISIKESGRSWRSVFDTRKKQNRKDVLCSTGNYTQYLVITRNGGTSLLVQWIRCCTPSAGVPCSIPGQETRSHMPLKEPACQN